MIAWNGAGAGFTQLPTLNTLFSHTAFNQSFLYKKVDTLQQAAACGAIAVFDSAGTKMFIVGGEMLQSWVAAGATLSVPYAAARYQSKDVGQVYTASLGQIYTPKEMISDSAVWLDVSAQGTGWQFCGVITKATSLLAMTGNLTLHSPLAVGTPHATYASALAAQNTGDGIASSSEAPPVADRFAAWVAVPWHATFKSLLADSSATAIGGGDGASYVQQAYATHLAATTDKVPTLNLVVLGRGTSLYMGRGATNGYAEEYALDDKISAAKRTAMIGPAHLLHNAAYEVAWNVAFPTIGTNVRSTQYNYSANHTFQLPTVFGRGYRMGTPLSSAHGRVPSLGCSFSAYSGMDQNVQPGYTGGVWDNDGTRCDHTNVLAQVGGWDVRPFMSTVFPRFYFKASDGTADQSVGITVTAAALLSNSAQVSLLTVSHGPNETYVGAQADVSTDGKFELAYPAAELWPYDLVAQVTAWWNETYDQAQALAS